jgi:hypothetical protein
MTAQADIDALIRKADAEFKTADKDRRKDFAGFTAMAGLTILAKHVDALAERLDRACPDRSEYPVDVRAELAELRQKIENLSDQGRM